MKVKNPQFVISAVSPKQYPGGDLLDVAFAGRSNVGKSSLINALVGRKKLAYSSATQGKTRQINYYSLDDELYFVDLPGYGYAAVSKEEKNQWGKVMEQYLNTRKQLYLIIMLLDVRRVPSEEDSIMYRWILSSGIDYIITATKTDKLSRAQVNENVKKIRSTLQIPPEKDIICVSSEKRTGIDELWAAIDSYITDDKE